MSAYDPERTCGAVKSRPAAAHAKSALRSAQAGERDDKIAQALLRGGNTSRYKHRSIPLTQTA
jgi:hypothetical protein